MILVPERYSLVVTASGSRSCDPGSIPTPARRKTFLTTPAAPYLESYVSVYSLDAQTYQIKQIVRTTYSTCQNISPTMV